METKKQLKKSCKVGKPHLISIKYEKRIHNPIAYLGFPQYLTSFHKPFVTAKVKGRKSKPHLRHSRTQITMKNRKVTTYEDQTLRKPHEVYEIRLTKLDRPLALFLSGRLHGPHMEAGTWNGPGMNFARGSDIRMISAKYLTKND